MSKFASAIEESFSNANGAQKDNVDVVNALSKRIGRLEKYLDKASQKPEDIKEMKKDVAYARDLIGLLTKSLNRFEKEFSSPDKADKLRDS